VAAVPLAYGVARPISVLFGQLIVQTNLDFVFAWWAVGVWLWAILLIGVLASLLPAFSATRISVRQSLAYG
jgi:putative ABC transport system permease protein